MTWSRSSTFSSSAHDFSTLRSNLILGDDRDNMLYDDTGDDLILARGGDDQIFIKGGNNLISGGSGQDTISYYNADGGVTVDLSSHRAENSQGERDLIFDVENIQGSLFHDVLIGDDGDNVINGLYGRDTLTGNDGRDTFVLTDRNDAPDTITDFHSGEDILFFNRGEVIPPDDRPPPGQLDDQYLLIGDQAPTSEQKFVFSDHTLYLNAGGGSGPYGMTPLIFFDESASLSASDIWLS